MSRDIVVVGLNVFQKGKKKLEPTTHYLKQVLTNYSISSDKWNLLQLLLHAKVMYFIYNQESSSFECLPLYGDLSKIHKCEV